MLALIHGIVLSFAPFLDDELLDHEYFEQFLGELSDLLTKGKDRSEISGIADFGQ